MEHAENMKWWAAATDPSPGNVRGWAKWWVPLIAMPEINSDQHTFLYQATSGRRQSREVTQACREDDQSPDCTLLSAGSTSTFLRMGNATKSTGNVNKNKLFRKLIFHVKLARIFEDSLHVSTPCIFVPHLFLKQTEFLFVILFVLGAFVTVEKWSVSKPERADDVNPTRQKKMWERIRVQTPHFLTTTAFPERWSKLYPLWSFESSNPHIPARRTQPVKYMRMATAALNIISTLFLFF